MNTYPNYDDIYRTPVQSEFNKVLRVIFSGLFLAAVFVVPAVTAIKFFLA